MWGLFIPPWRAPLGTYTVEKVVVHEDPPSTLNPAPHALHPEVYPSTQGTYTVGRAVVHAGPHVAGREEAKMGL